MSILEDLVPALVPLGERPVDLVVVGDTGVDLMTSVTDLPGSDEKAIGRSLGIHPGGMGANFASAARAAEAGLRLELVSRVGDDPLGAACLESLADHGIGTERVARVPGELTFWCAVAIGADGEKALLGGRSAASLPAASQADDALLAQARWVHVLADVPGARNLLHRARRAGTGASVDVEGSFVLERPDEARALIDAADVSIVNSGAARMLTGVGDDLGALRALRAQHPDAIFVLTRGREGSILSAPSDPDRAAAAVEVERVADTTGAGDAYAGTLVASLLANVELEHVLARAAQAAAGAIVRIGSRAGGLPGWPGATPEEKE